MLRHRLRRMEALLDRRDPKIAAPPRPVWTADLCVKAIRALIIQVAAGADPFPQREREDYLAAFGPWILGQAEGWPAWAREYALRLCGIPSRDAGRLLRRRSVQPKPRPVQTAQDVIDLVEEQIDMLRAEDTLGPLEKARALASLAAVARKAIETGHLATRLDALTLVLQGRKESAS